REATSLPYTGWAIVVAWHAKTLPGAAQESRMTHQPGAHWGSELRFKLQFSCSAPMAKKRNCELEL
ncbi:MAG: hypothetical protein MR828_12355, partial [Clostridiales bacterium]|nr:hypothetical protein [Clostridiales bacterium]